MPPFLYELSWRSEFPSNNLGEPQLRISPSASCPFLARVVLGSAEVLMSDSHGWKGSGRDKATVYFGLFLPGSLCVCPVALTPFHRRRTEINKSMRTISKKPQCKRRGKGGGCIFSRFI